MATTKFNPVSRPEHYATLSPEPIEVIEAWGLDFHEANVLKYLARYQFKGKPIEDLEKASFYLQRKINILKKGKK